VIEGTVEGLRFEEKPRMGELMRGSRKGWSG
jgi:hypothetical protein